MTLNGVIAVNLNSTRAISLYFDLLVSGSFKNIAIYYLASFRYFLDIIKCFALLFIERSMSLWRR